MPARWTIKEETRKRKELERLYTRQNKTIFEVGQTLGIRYQTVYDRLKRLGIKPCPEKKTCYLNRSYRIIIPKNRSEKLSEFTGVLLGDGHISDTQVIVYANSLETDYISYVQRLITDLFKDSPRTSSFLSVRAKKHHVIDIRIGSVNLVKYFLRMGLVKDKVAQQVDIPKWIFRNRKYRIGFLRGFFDTDGSIYRLRFGVQICYKNASAPLLGSTREILLSLGYKPSQITCRSLYLTRKEDLCRFFKEIRPANKKHIDRASSFGVISRGTQVDNENRL